MGILYTILVGLIAGFLAGKLIKGSGFGVVGNLIVGVIGALLGGFLARVIGLAAHGLLAEVLVATGGAIVFLALLGFVKR
ncbi:MAG: GlsB/YeaQ/YmgE family stress response membrane protein [Planctomycetaceae bacterium]